MAWQAISVSFYSGRFADYFPASLDKVKMRAIGYRLPPYVLLLCTHNKSSTSLGRERYGPDGECSGIAGG